MVPLRRHAAEVIFTNIAEGVLTAIALSLERAAMGTRFSESGALCFQAHVTGLVQLFSSGSDEDDDVNQALLEHAKTRTLLARVRLIVMLLSGQRPSEITGILEEFSLPLDGKLPLSADEVRAVLRLRLDGCSEADIVALPLALD